jgi:hypothetical protein
MSLITFYLGLNLLSEVGKPSKVVRLNCLNTPRLRFIVLALIVMDDLFDAGTCLLLCLRCSHSRHLICKTRVALLGLPWSWPVIAEQDFNLLNGLATCLGVGEPELDGTGKTKGTKYDEQPPSNIEESGRYKETNRKIENPVSNGRDSHASGSGLEGPYFGGVDPANGGESECVDDDQ